MIYYTYTYTHCREGSFIIMMTQALLPLPQMRVIIERLMLEDRKVNAGNLGIILIEQ
jgi:hypothetical protein